jgi:hypothetical protein
MQEVVAEIVDPCRDLGQTDTRYREARSGMRFDRSPTRSSKRDAR